MKRFLTEIRMRIKEKWTEMTKLNKRECRFVIFIMAFFLAYTVFRGIKWWYPFPDALSILQSAVTIGLLIAWGVSAQKRVMQIQVRKQLGVIAGLMVFWLIVRTVKYYFVTGVTLSRYLWYLFYLPMLFIPLYALFTALLLGKSELAKLPGYTLIPAGISVLLFVFVMTNDLHQLVFYFTGEKPWSDAEYRHACVYYIIVAWLIICGAAMLAILLNKCRIPQSRRFIWLPGVPIATLIVYTILYLLKVSWFFYFFGDMTEVFCLLYTAVLESCMQTGLIQINTGYDMLFEAATFKAQITDENWHTRYTSVSAALGADVLSRAKDSTLRLGRNTLLKTNVISGGYVAWQEDVTELADTLAQLEENQQELEEENFVEQEALRARQEVLSLREKNRLYDLIGCHMRPQVEMLDTLLNEYEITSGENARRRLLAKICVIGAYVKRSGNLLLIRESGEKMPVSELARAIEESLQNLELSDAECGFSCTADVDIPTDIAVEAYAFFEHIIEAVIGCVDYLWVSLRTRNQELILHMELETEAELSNLIDSAEGHFEDGVWHITTRYNVGGDVV